MRIGIIDTGLEPNHKRLTGASINGVTLFEGKCGKIETINNTFIDIDGHGTGIASIIHKHNPKAELFIVKLDSLNKKITEALLTSAIKYLIENCLDIKLVNISMGIHTNEPSNDLIDICNKAYQENVILIASSYYYPEKECYPANFSNVISVGSGIITNKNTFRFIENGFTNVLAKGGFQRVASINNSFKFGSGTSLATAHFTGILSNIFSDEINYIDQDAIIEWVKRNSDNSIISLTGHDNNSSDLLVQSDSIKYGFKDIISTFQLKGLKKLALFPIEEKEMRSIVEFSDSVTHKIILGIRNQTTIKYDQHLVELLEEKGIKYINKIPSENDFNEIDTVVFGYFLDQLLDSNLYFGYQVINESINRNKNLIIWDKKVYSLIGKIIESNNIEYKGEIYFSNVNYDFLKKLYGLSNYPKLEVPVVAVVGTGSKQGKFTSQIVIRDILEKYQYRTSLISTEPQGILFGADFCFPIGHNPTVEINIGEWSRTIHSVIKGIEQTSDPEIIITGCQGGVIPKYNVALGTESGDVLKQLNFLIGASPDRIIMTISPNDDIQYIEKTINTIRTFVNCEILFYALTPWTYEFSENNNLYKYYKLSTTEYNEKLSFFEKELKVPVIDILEKSNEKFILESIQSSFSAHVTI